MLREYLLLVDLYANEMVILREQNALCLTKRLYMLVTGMRRDF